jgi:hypothetical protein
MSHEQPWTEWTLNRWVRYRDEQLAGLARARETGEKTDILEACVRLAESHIDRLTIATPLGDLQVQATVEDLAS